MPTGLALPHKIAKGRLVTSDDVEQLRKIIMIAMGPRQNSNPWNRAGIVLPMFSLDDPTTRSKIRLGVEEHSKKLSREGRATLELKSMRQLLPGVIGLHIAYNDLRTGKPDSVTLEIGRAV